MINTSFSSAITELLQDTCAKSLASASGQDGIRDIIETKNEYLICRFITDNLSQNMNIRYRELMAAKAAIRDVKSASPDVLEGYRRKAQVFRDTLIATKMQLEECGYKVGEKDVICGLCQHCNSFNDVSAECVYNSFLISASESDFGRALALYGTTGAGCSLQQSMHELRILNEEDWNDKNSRLYDCDFVKQLIVDAHNLVRSYEVEKQESLSMDNPLKRLASFSGVDDEQLDSWIWSEDAINHNPVYAAMYGYYRHADGAICNVNEDDPNGSEDQGDSEWLDCSDGPDCSDGYCLEDMDGEAGSEPHVLRRPLPQYREDTTSPSQGPSGPGPDCRTIQTLPRVSSSGLASGERQDKVTDDDFGSWLQRLGDASLWSRRGCPENDSDVKPKECILRRLEPDVSRRGIDGEHFWIDEEFMRSMVLTHPPIWMGGSYGNGPRVCEIIDDEAEGVERDPDHHAADDGSDSDSASVCKLSKRFLCVDDADSLSSQTPVKMGSM